MIGGAQVALATAALAACGSSQTSSSATPSSPAVSAAACSGAQLAVASGGVQGATGHLLVSFRLRNISARRCRIGGYPGVRLLGTSGRSLGMRERRGGGFLPAGARAPATVVLAPRAAATFVISLAADNEYAHAHRCRTATAAVLRAPVGDARWVRVMLPRAPLVAPCGRQVSVSPLT
ncbi:MAG: DUF4232 domain-containing protein [Solirubrobacteraceae bacterium]